MSHKELKRTEIIQKVIEKRISQKVAASHLHLTIRQTRRLCEAYRMKGHAGLISKHRGKKGCHVLPSELKVTVVDLARTIYWDFGPTFMAEKLLENHQIRISRESLRQLLIAEGIWKPKSIKEKKIHQQRERRGSRGELVQIDGSPHDWFEGRGPKCCLIVFIDDATSEILYLRLEPAETTQAYFRGLYQVIHTYGLPLSFYSDRHSIFRVNVGDDLKALTQFWRACAQLDIEIINANSPEAKGRVERSNQTHQDRLVKELRLANIRDIDAANTFLETYRFKHNQKFAKAASNSEEAFVVNTRTQEDLMHILSEQESRKVTKNLEIRFENKIYQIQHQEKGRRLQQTSITVCRTIMDEIILLYQGKALEYKVFASNQKRPPIVDAKFLNAHCDQRLENKKFHLPKPNKPTETHPWRRPIIMNQKTALLYGQRIT